MFTKSLIAAAVVVPAFALSSAVYAGPVYQGGPKSPIAVRAPNQTVDSKPYAQFVPDIRVGTKKYTFQGGPKSTIPHGPR